MEYLLDLIWLSNRYSEIWSRIFNLCTTIDPCAGKTSETKKSSSSKYPDSLRDSSAWRSRNHPRPGEGISHFLERKFRAHTHIRFHIKARTRYNGFWWHIRCISYDPTVAPTIRDLQRSNTRRSSSLRYTRRWNQGYIYNRRHTFELGRAELHRCR